MKAALIFTICSILFIVSCKDEKLIDEEIAAKAYVDLLIADEQFDKNSDSLKTKRDEIFKKYAIDGERYQYSYAEFAKDEEVWKSFNASAQAYLDTLKKQHGIK
jgi:hypothetical protein